MLLSVVLAVTALRPAAADELERRWLFLDRGLRSPEAVQATAPLLDRAAAAGYNGVLLSGLGWVNRASVPELASLREFGDAVRAHGLDLIACVMPINQSLVVSQDPNLAEGLPVRDTLYVVRGDEATPRPDHTVVVAGGGFEKADGDRMLGWQGQDEVGTSTFFDTGLSHTGKASARIEHLSKAQWGRARLSQSVAVRPFRQYRLSVWFRTQDYDGHARILVIAPTDKQRDLAGTWVPVERSADWQRCDLVVNSLGYQSLRVYLICGGGGEGRLWWDDLAVDEVGIMNPLRRAGCPVVVRADDGAVYEEGRDFERICDPLLAPDPTIHDSLPMRLTPDTRIRDGASLRVSYYHPLALAGYLVACMSEPRVYDIFREQVARVNEVLHPTGFLMYDDEIRIGNWDAACQDRRMTPGQLLADKVRRCTAIIRDIRPDAQIWDWSDMFDPMTNAVDEYYAVNGSWKGSWAGLDPSVGIVNWSDEHLGANFPWFACRGHKQVLAGFYDGDGTPIREWLAAGPKVPGIVGAMYTTWVDDHSQLETWAQQTWGGARSSAAAHDPAAPSAAPVDGPKSGHDPESTAKDPR
jgi:hypothetical protein